MKEINTVKVWEEIISIPTYGIGEPDKNPMFLEKRVYQGSSGKVYPHSVVDKIYDEKENKEYKAIYLENEYIQIMVLPELGGRIQRAIDKTNQYDFVYYNQVIKPALVGLAGPWISGGIEFNWPQHHRPSTFDPQVYSFGENEDGSCSIWVGEIENMFRTKGMAEFRLYPGKAYIEINARLYNRTNIPQTFLWWANPAVAVNEDTKSIFPPDVHAVMDHGKRDVSNFPIATGTYYKMDYSKGVDISRYKNIPVPTSYMAYHSDYDFVGGYDYQKEAGLLHVANHHISPGKKQWTWGCGEFGKAWDRNLTDEDGPYIELMTGCFTDNQPDFSWIMPYEEKTFTQYFMPYKGIGNVVNATKDFMVGMEDVKIEEGNYVLKWGVYSSGYYKDIRIIVQDNLGKVRFENRRDITPRQEHSFLLTVNKNEKKEDFQIILQDNLGKNLLKEIEKKEKVDIPEPAKPLPLPKDAKTCEDLYLYGMHLEQYRHATYDPESYYREGLAREEEHIGLNTALGKLLFKRGEVEASITYFEKAKEKSLRLNPNPYDSEPFYYLGLAYKYSNDKEKQQKSYKNFYKATWNYAYQSGSFYQIACYNCKEEEWMEALNHIEKSLVCNYHNIKARNLKTYILNQLNRKEEALLWTKETRKIDKLDPASYIELEGKEKGKNLLENNHNTYIEIAIDYMEAYQWEKAIDLLEIYLDAIGIGSGYPMVYYYLGYFHEMMNEREKALFYIKEAQNALSDYCFPHRLEDIQVLNLAKKLLPEGDKAYYYLGNLWYDKKIYQKAIHHWEEARDKDTYFPTTHRNLALAYYNKLGKRKEAVEELEKAFFLNEKDARVLMELDQLYKKEKISSSDRLNFLDKYKAQVESRDDLYLEYLTLLKEEKQYKLVIELLSKRNFHPWEGGEGKVSKVYVESYVELAKNKLEKGEFSRARELLLQAAGEYPHNLGEGKLYGTRENHIYFYLGLVEEKLENREKAKEYFEIAASGDMEVAGVMYYNDQPPEMIYYKGEALKKLGRLSQANACFEQLITYGKKHRNDKVKIDYFAVSLPDLQIFDEDLDEKNKIHCEKLIALGERGKAVNENDLY